MFDSGNFAFLGLMCCNYFICDIFLDVVQVWIKLNNKDFRQLFLELKIVL